MSFACHLYALIFYLMYSYVLLMSVVCTCMSPVCHSYVLVCHPCVTRMYSYVIRMSLVCTHMSFVCHSYVLVCNLHVTCIYSYVIRMSLVYTHMSLVCTRMSSVFTRMQFYHEPPLEVFCRKWCSYKNFANFTGKGLCWSVILIKVVKNFVEKRLQHRCFPLKFAKFLRTPISKNIQERLLLYMT